MYLANVILLFTVNISNIQFVDADSFFLTGRDADNEPVSGIYSLQDGHMVTKVGTAMGWSGLAPSSEGLAFVSEAGDLSVLKANGEI